MEDKIFVVQQGIERVIEKREQNEERPRRSMKKDSAED
jgi:hypothetical protein